MKHLFNERKWVIVLAAIFVFPAAVFLVGSVLKFEAGIPVFYDMAEPLMVRMGLNEKLGLNINLLIAFGPIVALALTLYSLVRIKTERQKDFFSLSFCFPVKGAMFYLALVSAFIMCFLLLYVVGENCHC